MATPQKVAVPQTKRGPAAAPQPSEEEEGEPWQQLDPDTEEIAASRANTPPSQSRKSSTASNRRLDGVRAYAALLDKRTRVIIVVAAVAVVLLGLMAAGVIWAYSYNNTPPAQPEKPPPARPPLKVGKDQKYKTVREAIQHALPGDHIIVQGPEHEEELVFDNQPRDNQPRKDLTIESEGEPVHWRTPKMKDSAVLVVLKNVEGLKLRNFIFDGDGRAKTGILLSGRCPGTTLEDLTIQGFTGSSLLIQNCEGEKGRPVTIKSLKITTAADKKVNAAVQFDPNGVRNRIIHFSELILDGPFTTPILNRELATEDVTGLPD